ncbi:Demethylmenaquinone methyltransferase [Mycena sanguinolenta]|uniref:Demethylmenaquinone methyltransferase n=1 Tax=Mycena sanguinolenta TaxID=230812 RepID=A0A8H6TS28_9AGAR|nr:Demethylmenaquinone methyltransferase [Mycena sanguinolenta]
MTTMSPSKAGFFQEMHGRKINLINPTYLLPADEDESKRFNLMHRLIRFIFNGRIYVGPTKRGSSVWAVPSSPRSRDREGEWAVELCEEFSWVFTTGVDIVPIQYLEVPERCRFEMWDINIHHMPYTDGCFDLVHARAVLTGIRNYPHFLGQIGRILRPGGLVLLIEPSLMQYAGQQQTGSRVYVWFRASRMVHAVGDIPQVPLHAGC